MMILAPIAAVMLQMALSRSREYEADHSGAELLGTGEPLARALEKIEAYAKQVPMNIDPAQATAYIINPLTGRKVSFAGLFQTHPPTAERVARLRATCTEAAYPCRSGCATTSRSRSSSVRSRTASSFRPAHAVRP